MSERASDADKSEAKTETKADAKTDAKKAERVYVARRAVPRAYGVIETPDVVTSDTGVITEASESKPVTRPRTPKAE